MIEAILRAQILSLRGIWLGGGRRSAAMGTALSSLWYLLWVGLAFFAHFLTSRATDRYILELALPYGLMIVLLYWQLAPLLAGSLGAALDLKKLLVYPIPHGRLFLIEVLLRLTTGVEMGLLMVGAFAGLLENPQFGGWRSAPRVVAAWISYVAFNLLLAAGIRNLIERLLARKRMREVLVLLWVLLMVLPQTIHLMEPGTRKFVGGAATWVVAQGWPWGAATHLALGSHGSTPWLVMGAWLSVACYFGRRQFEASLRFDSGAVPASGAAPARGEAWIEGLYTFPGKFLKDPVAAIVEKELRSLLRSPRFRLIFIMGFSFGVIVWAPLVFGIREGRMAAIGGDFLTLVGGYALVLLGQVTYNNAFGFDRSAVHNYFVSPVGISRVLIGKNLAVAFLLALEVLAVTLVCLVFRVGIPPDKMLESLLVMPVMALYLLAIGNMSSVHFPAPMDPDKASRGGAAGRFQALTLLLYPIVLTPVWMAYGARYAFDSHLAFYAVLALAAVIGGVVYWVAMGSALDAVRRRREILLAELTRSDGPMTSK